jgi:hypothetical protein
MDNGNLAGRYPAIVNSYDAIRRTCRINIPGISSGGDINIEAEIEYPLGDKSRAVKWNTEIEILAGDAVWVDFIGGDPRYPVITGYRNPQLGNGSEWRRWHHKNIELNADKSMMVKAGESILINANKSVTIKAGESLLIQFGGSITLEAG